MKISSQDRRECFFTLVYGSPTYTLRKNLRRDLNQETLKINKPWLIAGDFNSVTHADETSNPDRLDQRRCIGFVNWIFEHGLLDLGFSGPKFTWMRGNTPEQFKGARLYRAICNMDWRTVFPQTKVTILPNLNSDHSPVKISMSSTTKMQFQSKFRFQAAWITHPGFKKVIQKVWRIVGRSQKVICNGIRISLAIVRKGKNEYGRGWKGFKRLW